jgi:peptide/nickel transport system substrate-binding protein
VKRYLIGIIFLLTSILVLTGCNTASSSTSTSAAQTKTALPSPTTTVAQTKTTSTTTATAPTSVTPQIGGNLITLYVGATGSITNLGDPAGTQSAASKTARAPCLEKLIKADQKGNYMPFLAEKWTFAEDGKSFNLYLRKGVKFHDGSPFNAQVVKFNLDLSRNTNLRILQNITSIDIVDDYTVKVNLPDWDWGVFNALESIDFVSEAAYKANGVEWAKVNPIGTGPYKFSSFKQDVSVKFVRFDDYWGGKPYLDSVEFKLMADSASALMAFKAKEGHVLGGIEPKDVQDLVKAGFKLTTSIGSPSMFDFPSNNPESPFAKLKVRQAFSYAIDREAISSSLGFGYYQPTYQPWSRDYWAYSDNVEGHPFNQTKAKQLLTDAGYPNGITTKMYTTKIDSLVTLVQDYLKKVGITVDVQVVSQTVASQQNLKGHDDGIKADTFTYGAFSDPATALSATIITLGTTHVSTQRYPDLEALYNKIASERDTAKRKALLADFNKLEVDTYCGYVWVYSPKGITARDPKVQGLLDEVEGSRRVYDKAWLAK